MRFFLIVSIFVFSLSYSQGKKKSTNMSNIDSTLNKYFYSSSKEALVVKHSVLQNSIESSNIEGVLKSYRSLVWHHGYLVKKEYRLDCTLYYCKLFENKIKKLKNVEQYSNIISAYYIDKGDVLGDVFEFNEESLNSFIKAYPYIDKNDVVMMMDYNISISRVYNRKNEYTKGLNILKKCLKDTVNMSLKHKVFLMQEIASTHQSLKQYEESLDLNLKSLKTLLKLRNPKRIWWVKNEISRDYYNLGMYKRALDSAIVVKKNFEKINYKTGLDNNLDLLSQIYEEIDIDTSIEYLELALKGNELYYSHSEFFADQFERLASLYEKKNQFEKSNIYYKKSNRIHDSIRLRKAKLFITYTDLTTKYFNEKELNEAISRNNDLLIESKKEQKLFFLRIITVLFILLLLFVVLYYYDKSKKVEKKVEKLEINEKRLLEDQIIIKNNELEATASMLTKRVDVLTKLKGQLEGVEKSNEDKIKDSLKIIANLIQNASDMKILNSKMSSKYSSLSVSLKKVYPDLTPREIDYCLLTKLNLSIKETAAMLNVSPATVKVARSRLKQKMNIDADVSLLKHLDTIL